ncbi:MAG: hypothetical protein NE328_11115 [Lentisphaeraceae bacterium]|nr:hypothetical protein [Lentisphaeraceae bacterium]
MKDLLFFILFISLLTTVIGAIPYLIWLFKSVKKKDWKKVKLLASIPIAFYLILISSTYLAHQSDFYNYFVNVFGTEFDYEDPILEYHSDRAFNGDGISYEMYKLPVKVRERFSQKGLSALKNYPSEVYDGWSIVHWQKIPYKENHQSLFNMLLVSDVFFDDSSKSKIIKQAQESISSPNTFYACFYYRNITSPLNVTLFIIDLEKNLFFRLNIDT